MNKIRYRYWQSLLFIMTLAVFFISFYLQYAQQLEPCPLCLMQRFSACLFGACCMIALRVRTRKWALRVSYTQLIFAIFGIYFATRQLWLQSLPPGETLSCLPALDIMIKYFPWRVVLETLLWGSSSCAEITWVWLGLSIAAWSLLYFLAIFLLICFVFIRLNRSQLEF